MFKLLDTISPFGYLMPKMFLSLAEENAGVSDGGDEGEGSGGGGGGSGTEDWRTGLPDNIKAHPVLSKYKTKDDAVTALVAAQELIGADKIIIPSKDAKEEEWNERVWNRLGRPEKAELYALPTDIEIPKELPVDEKFVAGFKETAHKYGLLPHQVAGLYKWYMEENIASFNNIMTGRKTAMGEAETKLRRDWGAAYDQNVSVARKVVNKFASPEVVDLLADGLGNDPRVIRMFADIGKVLSEDQLLGKPKGLTLTPEEAQVEVKKLEADLKGPLYDANHPEHAAVIAKRDALYKMIHGE